jgi:hypothetical protein
LIKKASGFLLPLFIPHLPIFNLAESNKPTYLPSSLKIHKISLIVNISLIKSRYNNYKSTQAKVTKGVYSHGRSNGTDVS